MLAALHHQHGLGLGTDDGFVVDELVAVEIGKGVGRAGQADDAIGCGGSAGDHRAVAGQREHESDLEAPADLRAHPIEGCEFVANAADQAFPAFGCGGALRHDADLLDDAGAGKFVRYGDERNFRRLQNFDGLFRSRTLQSQYKRRREREHAFGGELPHVADIRFLLQRRRRKEARRIDCDDFLLQAERVQDFGDRAADRYDAACIGDRNGSAGCVGDDAIVAASGVSETPKGREPQAEASIERTRWWGLTTFHRMSLFCGDQAQVIRIVTRRMKRYTCACR